MAHTCHAEGCAKAVPPRMLFCLPHWRKTPRHLQAAIWRTYREGQEVRKNPSALYLVVQAMAVAAVARMEGKFTPDQAVDHIHGRIELVWSRLTDADAHYLETLV